MALILKEGKTIQPLLTYLLTRTNVKLKTTVGNENKN